MKWTNLRDISLFISAIIFGSMAFLSYFDKGKSISAHNINNAKIQAVLQEGIKYCGIGYYSSLFDIKDHLTNTGSKKATMIEQYGWLPIIGKGWKVTPTKTFNKNWSKSISIDDKLSLDFIHSFKDTKPVYYPNIKTIQHIPLINQLLKRSDVNPRSASVVVVKENSNIIYANILSNTDPKNQKCENQKGYKILQKTANFIKDLL
jgi:hypothetical protein